MGNARSTRRKAGKAQADTERVSLRTRLRNRPRPTLTYPLLVADTTEPRRKLERAQQRLRQARLRYRESDHEQARQRIAAVNADPDATEQARQQAAADLARCDRWRKALDDAQEKADQAQQALNDCYQMITLRAMRPDQYEQLLAAHPPTPEQRQAAAGGEPPIWNDDSFRPALIAATALTDMTADDWAVFLSGDDAGNGASPGEVNELWAMVIGLNERARFADNSATPFV